MSENRTSKSQTFLPKAHGKGYSFASKFPSGNTNDLRSVMANAAEVAVIVYLSNLAPSRYLPAAMFVAFSLGSALSLKAQDTVTEEEWARLKIEQCRGEEQHRSCDLQRLTETLKREAQSKEELAFPKAEAEAHAKLLKNERRLRLAELEYLLFRREKETVEAMFLRQVWSAAAPEPLGRATFRKAMRVFIDSATPCALSALESTLVVADFGLPLKRQWADQAISGGQILEEVENEYARGAAAGKTSEQMYIELRPAGREQARLLTRTLLQGMMTSSSKSAALSSDVQQHVVSDLEEFLYLAAEPLRMEMYLDILVGDFERYLGIRSSERAIDRLQKRVRDRLFKNAKMMRDLANSPPRENARNLSLVLDEWLKKEGLPQLVGRLFEDPFSAYWFYVQTGMVARRPSAFQGSRLRVNSETPELKALAGLPLDAAQTALLREKIPHSYVERFQRLEHLMTETILPHEELVARAARNGVDDRVQQRLKKIVEEMRTNGSVSSLELMSFFVRDASRVQGAPDTQALMAGLQALRGAKREAMNRELEALPETPDRNHLVVYLRTAGEWMLELEEREAREKHFQESTGGGPVGWILRRTAIGNGVPPELWAPGGVTGEAFARLIDEVVSTNTKSGWSYHSKETSDIQFLDSGEAYYRKLVEVINDSKDFLNIQQFDWKLDRGGKEIAYRLMAKKLGLTGQEYDSLAKEFRGGTFLNDRAKEKALFYDVPTTKIKNLLFYKLFASSNRQPIAGLRQKLESSLGGPLQCPNIASCGDLSAIRAKTGSRYNKRRESEQGYRAAWEAYRELESLFEEHTPELKDIPARRSLAEYIKSRAAVQRFIRRCGLKRSDAPNTPLDINIVTEGKRDSWNLYFKGGKLHDPLYQFGVRYLPWKGWIEYPWHVGRAPLPGRWLGGVIPIPYVPWPWLEAAPGFGWAGVGESLVLQHLAATDIRNGWGMLTHGKNISSESQALESGMGFASKYFNLYPGFRTWHDTGAVARGALAGDANDQFIKAFHRARRNNRGLPESQGVKVPRLNYEDYAYPGKSEQGYRAWFLTTDPDARDYNYRGAFLATLAAARENIYIENAFFSDSLISKMLVRKAREFRAHVDCGGLTELACAAKKRNGVNIYLILPRSTDQPLVDVVSRSDYFDMINEGVKIYLWDPHRGYAAKQMLHTKAWLVDYRPGQPALVYVGSHNANQRSLWADNEMGTLSSSPDFAKSVYEELFSQDMSEGTTLANPSFYNIERKIRPVHSLGRFVRRVMVDLLWVF